VGGAAQGSKSKPGSSFQNIMDVLNGKEPQRSCSPPSSLNKRRQGPKTNKYSFERDLAKKKKKEKVPNATHM